MNPDKRHASAKGFSHRLLRDEHNNHEEDGGMKKHYLTDDESKVLSMSIDVFLADDSPGASFKLGADSRMTRWVITRLSQLPFMTSHEYSFHTFVNVMQYWYSEQFYLLKLLKIIYHFIMCKRAALVYMKTMICRLRALRATPSNRDTFLDEDNLAAVKDMHNLHLQVWHAWWSMIFFFAKLTNIARCMQFTYTLKVHSMAVTCPHH